MPAPSRFTLLDAPHLALADVERVPLDGGQDVLLEVLLESAKYALEVPTGIRLAIAATVVPAVLLSPLFAFTDQRSRLLPSLNLRLTGSNHK
jgi:hypothetical protein